MAKIQNTEDRIVDAAKTVFIQKGMDGARMQEIANEAGINKALLHYYFRTKARLFDKVFSLVFREVFAILQMAITNELSFEEFLEQFINEYIALLKRKPYIPQFVIHELNRNPQMIVDQMNNTQFDKQKLFGLIEKAAEDKVIRPIHPVHLVTNILSMCIFPFIAKPIVTGFAFDGDKEEFRKYIDERPQQVVDFVKNAIMIQN